MLLINISVLPADLDKINISDEIKEIINEYVINYPITFVEKESLDYRADKLSELFWIKDVKGNFIVAKKSFVIN